MSDKAPRTCTVCQETKPTIAANFRYVTKERGGKSLPSEVCRECEAKAKVGGGEYQSVAAVIPAGDVAMQMAAMQKLSTINDNIIQAFNHAFENHSCVPHTAEYLEAILAHVNGIGDYAKLLWFDFLHSAPGSSTRVKLHGMITKLIVSNTEQGGAKKPVENLTDEEIDASIDELLRARSQPRLSVSDGPESATA